MTVSFSGLLRSQLTKGVAAYYNASNVELIKGDNKRTNIYMQSADCETKALPEINRGVDEVADMFVKIQHSDKILDLNTFTIENPEKGAGSSPFDL